MTKLTKNFSKAELASRDGMPVPDEYLDNARAVCERAQALRDLLGQPVQVNSGYRSPAHNTRVGGAPSSQHLTASALDIRSHGWTGEQLRTLYEGLIRLGLVPDGGVGTYPNSPNILHIDLGRPRRWRG